MATNSDSIPGRRLFPVMIDNIAESDPDKAWASIPVSSTLSDGYRDVSFKSFANAINRAAWFLESSFGRSANFTTVAYIGKPDMRYHVFSMAAAKTGYQVRWKTMIILLKGLWVKQVGSLRAGSLHVSHQQPGGALELTPVVRV